MSRKKVKRTHGKIITSQDDGKPQVFDEPVIKLATKDEQAFIERSMGVCGECMNYNFDDGQEMIKAQQLPEMLLEENHKLEWYENQEQYGLCEQTETMVPAGMSVSGISRWLFDSSYVGDNGYIKQGGMDKIPCPHFKKGQKFTISKARARQMKI